MMPFGDSHMVGIKDVFAHGIMHGGNISYESKASSHCAATCELRAHGVWASRGGCIMTTAIAGRADHVYMLQGRVGLHGADLQNMTHMPMPFRVPIFLPS